jgi:D-amino-acid oxidase
VADPAPGYGFGFAMTAPVVDMNRYLPHLQRRLEAAGGTLEQAHVRDLEQVGRAGGATVVVDAAGLGARELAGDTALRAVRGQTVLLRNPGLTRWLCDEDEEEPGAGGEAELSYVLPRLDDVVVGGTAGEDDEHAAPRPATAERILARAVALVPELAGAQVLEHRVGLRPARPRVRLEVERAPGGPVVHCYGHGGAGVTLSWGCADDVLAAVAALV